jgi:hypothetical protein
MTSTNQIVYDCTDCNYKSNIKSNLTRHVKTKHPERNTESVDLEEIKKILEKKEVKKVEKNTDNEIDNEIDIETYINDKVNQILKDNSLPPIKVPKNVMKDMFSGTIPTFVAGNISGYILSQLLPSFFFSIRNQALKSLVPQRQNTNITNTKPVESSIPSSV